MSPSVPEIEGMPKGAGREEGEGSVEGGRASPACVYHRCFSGCMLCPLYADRFSMLVPFWQPSAFTSATTEY